MKKILLALQFLTIIPLRIKGRTSEEEIGRATTFFPLIGVVEGCIIAIIAVFLTKALPSDVVNAVVILLLIVINGGLHLDGLADTFDAIASRGDKEKKLSVMKDSSVGPIGVIAIVMELLINYLLLNAILFYAMPELYYGVLLLMPVSTRWAMVCAIYYSKSAKNEGLGRLFIEHTKGREFIISTAITFGSALLLSLLSSGLELFLFFCIIAFPLLYIMSITAVWFLNRQFGGLTGDSFGAINEIQRITFLMVTVIWLRHYIS